MSRAGTRRSSSTSSPGRRQRSSSPATAPRAASSRPPPAWRSTSGPTPKAASTPSTTWSPGPTSSGSWTGPATQASPRLRPRMPDRERGPLRGPPRSLLSATDSRRRRSGHQLGDGGVTLAQEIGNCWLTRGQTMTCSPRWGSNPNGLPFGSETLNRDGALCRRHEGDGSESHHEARHGHTTTEQSLATDKTPAQRAHDEAGEVHDVGTGLAALAHPGASVGARRAAKHQPRGFMVEPTGVHDDRRAWAIAWLTPMNRTQRFRRTAHHLLRCEEPLP